MWRWLVGCAGEAASPRTRVGRLLDQLLSIVIITKVINSLIIGVTLKLKFTHVTCRVSAQWERISEMLLNGHTHALLHNPSACDFF